MRQPGVFDRYRQSDAHVEDDDPDVRGALGHEVLDSGENTVAWAALGVGVPDVAVDSALGRQAGIPPIDAEARTGLALPDGNGLRRVVAVASPLRPRDVV